MTDLERLFLDGTKITNAGLPALGRLPNLTKLGLMETSVDDDGLRASKPCTRLESLHHKQTGITEAGLGKLKPHMPKLLIGTTERPSSARRTEE